MFGGFFFFGLLFVPASADVTLFGGASVGQRSEWALRIRAAIVDLIGLRQNWFGAVGLYRLKENLFGAVGMSRFCENWTGAVVRAGRCGPGVAQRSWRDSTAPIDLIDQSTGALDVAG